MQRRREREKVDLRTACGEGLCVHQLPASPRSRGTSCGFIQLPSPGSEEDAECAQPQGQNKSCGRGPVPLGSALGPAGLREQHTGAFVLWTRLLGRDV